VGGLWFWEASCGFCGAENGLLFSMGFNDVHEEVWGYSDHSITAIMESLAGLDGYTDGVSRVFTTPEFLHHDMSKSWWNV